MDTVNDFEYRTALNELHDEGFCKKLWLIDHFELFKTTLIWPEGKPPIGRSLMRINTLRGKFHITYTEILNEFDHRLNNTIQSLEFL